MADTEKWKNKKAEKLSNTLDFLEEDMIQETMKVQQKAMGVMEQETEEVWKNIGKKRKGLRQPGKRWRTWASLAACLILITVAVRLLPRILYTTEQAKPEAEQDDVPSSAQNDTSETIPGEQGAVEENLPATDGTAATEGATDNSATDDLIMGNQAKNQAAYGFTMENGIVYFPISFDDRIRFGLLRKGADDPEASKEQENQQEQESQERQEKQELTEIPGVDPDGMGLTPENTYQITEQDLGEVMGTVQDSADAGMIGCTVYHFASFPELDAICILEREGEYAFYIADGIRMIEGIGQSIDRVFTAYQMPESVTKLEVEDRNRTLLFTITDQAVVEELCTLLVGKTDIGMQANNERYAKRWKDTFGNEEVFYDGESFHYSDQVDYDAVHEFWHQNQRVIWVTTERGFRFLIQYNPDVRTIECYGYYDLSEEEVERLNILFGISSL